ncbi:hypothetical protein ARMGADRAFT_1169087 [Armillaria gallica]|uniref:Uncharacterized protein n=1 Tax=Armillaria gallica TaxID=47427 RepID=A0A2H3D741_ARMGA|nr:hypothetical protein ARMGADRAFT_1169087 [Armillaria gallica]
MQVYGAEQKGTTVAATGPEFAPFALVAFITAYALAPDFGFPVPIYHGVHTCLHNLPRFYQRTFYMDGLDAMPLCDANVAGMESVGGKDQGGELGCMNVNNRPRLNTDDIENLAHLNNINGQH